MGLDSSNGKSERVRRSNITYTQWLIMIGLPVLAFALAPVIIHDGYITHIFIMIVLYAYLGVAWNIQCGYAGQLSIGQGVFLGIGAYASTLLYVRLGVNPWLAMLFGAIVNSLFAFLVGFLLFRLRDAFFALSTMALLKVITLLAIYFRGLTNGNLGISLPIKGSYLTMTFSSKESYFYLGLILLAIITFASYKIRYSRLGLNWLALRDDHDAAESLGIDTHISKVISMTISAALISLGGTFLSHYILYIDPISIFEPRISLQMILVSILGGVGTAVGPIIGSLLMIPVDSLLRSWLGGQVAGLNFIIYGLMIMIVVRFLPDGVVPKLQSFINKTMRGQKNVSIDATNDDKNLNELSDGSNKQQVSEQFTKENSNDTVILAINNLGVRFGGLNAVKNLTFELKKGEILGIIGPNGAGKTTVFNLISGFIKPTTGTIEFNNRTVRGKIKPHYLSRKGLTRTFQIVKPFRKLTVLENVIVATIQKANNYNDARKEAISLLGKVGLVGLINSLPTSLTIAQQKKLEIARALGLNPNLLLLDEPMAGLNPIEVDDMVNFVKSISYSGVTIVIIEHVMKAIMTLCGRIIVLDHGEKIAEGSPYEIANNQKVIDVYLGEKCNDA